MQNNLIGETFDDYEVIECVGQINPKRRTYYYKLKCKICGEEKISPKTHKNGFNGRYVHNKTTCTNTFKRLEIGKTYGDYTVIRYVDSKNNKNRYEVKCNICNRTKIVSINHLQNNKGTSHSSCVKLIENVDKRFYSIWSDIRKRTTNKNCLHYKNYGGRGISSESYKFFIDFYDDMYESYIKHCEQYGEFNTTIDRIDVDGNYENGNCRWATIQEQNRNTRKQKHNMFLAIDMDGNEYYFNCITDFAEQHGLCPNNIYNTINGIQKNHKGWKFKKIK